MKYFATILLLAFIASAYAGALPANNDAELKPELKPESVEAEAAPTSSEARNKRGIVYAAPYAAAYSYPYAAAYSYPVAYSAPVAYTAAYRSYYPSYYGSFYY